MFVFPFLSTEMSVRFRIYNRCNIIGMFRGFPCHSFFQHFKFCQSLCKIYNRLKVNCFWDPCRGSWVAKLLPKGPPNPLTQQIHDSHFRIVSEIFSFKATQMTLRYLWLSSGVKIFLELVHEYFPQCICLPHTYSTVECRAPHSPALSAPQRSWAWANSFCLSSPPTHFEKRLRDKGGILANTLTLNYKVLYLHWIF